jgi:hypothetical protein
VINIATEKLALKMAIEVVSTRPSEDGAVMLKGSAVTRETIRCYACAPEGHREDWMDSFRNDIVGVYAWIKSVADSARTPAATATIYDDYCTQGDVIDLMLQIHPAGDALRTAARG